MTLTDQVSAADAKGRIIGISKHDLAHPCYRPRCDKRSRALKKMILKPCQKNPIGIFGKNDNLNRTIIVATN